MAHTNKGLVLIARGTSINHNGLGILAQALAKHASNKAIPTLQGTIDAHLRKAKVYPKAELWCYPSSGATYSCLHGEKRDVKGLDKQVIKGYKASPLAANLGYKVSLTSKGQQVCTQANPKMRARVCVNATGLTDRKFIQK